MKLWFSVFYMNLLVDIFTSNNSEPKHLENARRIQMNGGTNHLIEPHIIKNTNTVENACCNHLAGSQITRLCEVICCM